MDTPYRPHADIFWRGFVIVVWTLLYFFSQGCGSGETDDDGSWCGSECDKFFQQPSQENECEDYPDPLAKDHKLGNRRWVRWFSDCHGERWEFYDDCDGSGCEPALSQDQ